MSCIYTVYIYVCVCVYVCVQSPTMYTLATIVPTFVMKSRRPEGHAMDMR